MRDAFNYGKPMTAISHGAECFKKEVVGGVQVRGKGVYLAKDWSSALLADFEICLKTFKFLDRFPVDSPSPSQQQSPY